MLESEEIQSPPGIIPGRFQQVPYPSIYAAVNAAPSERVLEFDGADTPSGPYRRSFEVEEGQLEDGDIVLRFGAMRRAFQVCLNGRNLGRTQGRCVPDEFSVKPFLHSGANELVLTGLGESAASPISGVFQAVSLIFFPIGGLFDFTVSCRFDGAYQDAQLSARFVFDGSSVTQETHRTVRWYLYEPGKIDVFASSPPLSITLDGTENPVLQNQVWVTEPRQWSAEFPFLYNLVVEVTDDSGYTVDVRSMAWGFRQIEILGGSQGGMLTLNGQSIKVQGVRHGNSHPSELTESDLMLMKRLNINALYCPLHPLPATLCEIADKIGLYIVDSAIADSQGIAAVVPRHQNHPSVIIWSLECETPNKYFFREMKEAVKSLDDSRPVYCQGDRSVSDVLWCSDALPTRPQGKPVFIGAAAHELESSPVSFMKEMEERMDVGGVFVCDFVDPESPGSGIVTSQRQWKSEAMELQTLYAPVSIEPADMENGTITVSNRHFFIDLFDYEIYWSLQRNGEIVAGGMVRQPSIAPGGSKNVHLFRELAAFPGMGEGFLTFSLRLSEDNTWAAAGDEIAKMQIPVPETAKSPRAYPRISLSNSITSDAVTQKPDAEEERQDIPWQYKILGSDLLAVRADVGVRVNLVNGLMESLDFGLGSMLTMGLTPDVSSQGAVSTKLAGYKIKQHSGSLELWLKLKAPEVGRHLRLTLRLMADGRISFLLRGSPANPKTNLGVQFGLQSRYRQVKWYGCGPHPACSVDQKSAIVGLYSMQDDEQWDCRKRIGVRWMEFSDGGNALRISEEGGLLNFSCRFGPAGTSGECVGTKEGGGSDYLHVRIDGGDERGKKASLSRTRELQFTFSLKKHV